MKFTVQSPALPREPCIVHHPQTGKLKSWSGLLKRYNNDNDNNNNNNNNNNNDNNNNNNNNIIIIINRF